MATRSLSEIEELYSKMMELMGERLVSALIVLNRSDRIGELLDLLDMEELQEQEEAFDSFPDGDILVIGDTAAAQKDLIGVAKALGIAKERLRFVDFEGSKSFNYRSLEYSPNVCAVLVGAMPHKTSGSADSSSAITHMEKHREKYPIVVRMSANGALKVTKSNFRESLEGLIDRGIIKAA